MSSAATYLINGMSTSALLIIAALGLVVILGLMRVINLAHGELIMLGAYVSYHLNSVLGVNFYVSLIAAFVVTALIGALIEKIIIKRLYARPMETLLATFGVSKILQQAIALIYGPEIKYIQVPMDGRFTIGEAVVPYYNLFAIVVAVIMVIITWTLFYKISFGKKIRAISQNRNMCECLGIATKKFDTYTFAYGSGLAGFAGAVLSPIRSVSPYMGGGYLTNSFMTVVFGGTGSIVGAATSATIIGESISLIGGFLNDIWAQILVFAIVIIIVRFRPEGLFTKERR